jgi:hypothetical protein
LSIWQECCLIISIGFRAWKWKTIVKFMKSAILAGAAALAIGVPAEAVRNSGNRGTVQGLGGSGWVSPGYRSTPRTPKASIGGSSSSDVSPSGRRRVPEPSNLLMLRLGMVDLIIGRMATRRRKIT